MRLISPSHVPGDERQVVLGHDLHDETVPIPERRTEGDAVAADLPRAASVRSSSSAICMAAKRDMWVIVGVVTELEQRILRQLAHRGRVRLDPATRYEDRRRNGFAFENAQDGLVESVVLGPRRASIEGYGHLAVLRLDQRQRPR